MHRNDPYNEYGAIAYKNKPKTVHRLILAWITGIDLDGKWEARHHCDNPKCINPDHIDVGTHKDNMKDRAKRFRGHRGETHNDAKLTENTVVHIRNLYASGGYTFKELGKMYDVHKHTIRNAVRRKTWKHVL